MVVNDDLNRAYRDVAAIVTAERLRSKRIAPGVDQLVDRLMGERAEEMISDINLIAT